MDTDKNANPKKFRRTRSIFTHLRRYLLTGIVVLAPAAVTIWVLWNMFAFIDSRAKTVLGDSLADIPGIGFILLFAVIILVGVFATNIIGKRLIYFGEKIMARIPLANRIYMAVQQISTAFLGSQRSIFDKVVIVEYPRKGIYSLGFVTSEAGGEVQYKTTQRVVCVFIPTTPNPTSGLLIFVPREDLIYLDMTAEDGLKMVISGGVVSPAYFNDIEAAPQKLDKKE